MLNLLGAPYRMLGTAAFIVNRSIQVVPEITEAAIKQSQAVQIYWTGLAIQGLTGTLRAMNSLYYANLSEGFATWVDTICGGDKIAPDAGAPAPPAQAEKTLAASSSRGEERKATPDPGSANPKIVKLGKPRPRSVKKERTSRTERKELPE